MTLAVILIILAAFLFGAGILLSVVLQEGGPIMLCIAGLVVGLSGFGYRDSALAEQKLLSVSVKGSSADCSAFTDNSSQADKFKCQLTEPVTQETVTEFRTRNLTIWILDDKLQIQEGITDGE